MRITILILLFLPIWLTAQTEQGLVAFYPFEGNLGDATGSSDNLGTPEGAVDFDCGVSGEALLLGMPEDLMRIPGGATTNVNRIFADQDFTVSFYFKPVGANGTQLLLSKRSIDCSVQQYFTISYLAGSRSVRVVLRQGNVDITLQESVDETACWQHVTVRRRDRDLRLFLNGEPVSTRSSPSRINVANDGDILIGGGACAEPNEQNFTGLIEELRFYGRALDVEEVAELYGNPDRILTPDSRIFLGQSVTIDLNSNCGVDFAWSPVAGISDPTLAEPTITPTEAGRQTYEVEISGNQSACVATDSIEIIVIDPNSLNCDQVFFPKAFTPNGIGPEENETFGISNPFAIRELVSLEIFDRYGGRVFNTSDAFARWDGNFNNQPVNAGVMLWRVIYLCEGQEIIRTGSVTILR